jgi:hypothetical protein
MQEIRLIRDELSSPHFISKKFAKNLLLMIVSSGEIYFYETSRFTRGNDR